jgi:hypothetical protein
MKTEIDTVSKNIILTYARKIRNVQKEQIDPYIGLIENELITLFPELKDREDNALNWAYDILNAESNTEVVETLTRLEKIITNERKEKWICNYCGKNTYNDDVEYLFGTNHIGCALEEDIKNREHSDPDYILDARLRKITEIESKLNYYESELDKLHFELKLMRSDYPHEPTN